LTIKMLFRQPYFKNVDMIDSVKRRRFFQIWCFHNWKMIFIDKENTLFFREQRFEHLNEFLLELKKANPACKIEDSLM